MHRPARCRDREWTGGVDDPQPDRHTGKIAIRSKFLGSLSAFQLGRLARIRTIDPSRTTNTRTGLSTWEGWTQEPKVCRLPAGGDWIRTSSTRAREVGCRAPTAAKSNGSTKPLSMHIVAFDQLVPRTRAGGQGHRCARPLGRGPHRGRRFIARAITPGNRYYEGSRSGPAVTACQHYFENCSFSRDVMRQSSRAVLRRRSNGAGLVVWSCERSCLRADGYWVAVPYTTVSSRLNRTGISFRTLVCPSAPLSTTVSHCASSGPSGRTIRPPGLI